MQSFWEEERKNYKEYESIKNDMKTSVCVVGGGLTGLTTAYYLIKYTNVVLLERDRICSRTSGRNTGKVTSQHGVFYKYLIDSQGKEFAKKYLEANQKARWWDYSQRKFNLNGRVCLGTIIPFGILGLMVTYVTNPFLLDKLELIPEMWLNIVSGILFAIYAVDNIVSGVVIKAIKKADITASKETDNTEEITKKVREILQSKSALHRRLVDAFPKLQAVKIKIKDQTEKIKKEAIRQKEEIETKVEDTTKAIAEKVSNVSITGKKKKQIKEEKEK